jgi:hypothetical protein
MAEIGEPKREIVRPRPSQEPAEPAVAPSEPVREPERVPA